MDRVLIVDDDPIVLKQLRELIISFNYEVSFVPRAEFAFKRLETEEFDLVLLDINMPGMNGIEVLKKLREDDKYKDLPVIMITGVGNDETLIECFKLGANDYIEKPINEVVLKARVDAAITASNYMKEIVSVKNSIIKHQDKIHLQEMELEKQKTIQYKLKYLSAQMNPHFIFNSLYSIMHYITKGDIDYARDYIVDFSALMRETLENSVHRYISLEEEIDYLEKFLKLESLRFGDHLSYKITVDKSIDFKKTKIPPMLVQPHVENSILHGIKNKEEPGTVEVKFSNGDGVIVCSIIDDGVGIERSKEINEKRNKGKHSSAAIRITSTRLELLNSLENGELSIEINDIKDGSNKSLGTRVDITISKNLKENEGLM